METYRPVNVVIRLKLHLVDLVVVVTELLPLLLIMLLLHVIIHVVVSSLLIILLQCLHSSLIVFTTLLNSCKVSTVLLHLPCLVQNVASSSSTLAFACLSLLGLATYLVKEGVN